MSLTPKSRFRPNFLQLEDRSLPAAQVTAAVSGGTLVVKGTTASDTIIVRQNYNTVTVQANAQKVMTFTGVNKIDVDGGNGNDAIYVDNTARRANAPIPAYLKGGAGNDMLAGGDGNDTLDGGAGNNALYGGAGNDVINGGDGNDLLSGNAGNDTLNGGAGNDSIYGGNGNDDLVGGAGADYLDAGAGEDEFDGGTGFDTFKNQFDPVSQLPSASDGTDVNQGLAGTCVVLASISSVFDSGVDLPSKIRQVGTNQYAVPLFRPGTGWVEQVVKFDGTWTDNDPKPDGNGGYWTLLYQRAYLQEMGVNWADTASATWVSRYGAEFQRADRALLALTGKATWYGSTDSGLVNADLERMRKLLLQNKSVIALTYSSDGDAGTSLGNAGLIRSHAYSVLDMVKSGSSWYVRMRNPWGTDGPIVQGENDGIIQVSWSTFSKTMMGYSVAV